MWYQNLLIASCLSGNTSRNIPCLLKQGNVKKNKKLLELILLRVKQMYRQNCTTIQLFWKSDWLATARSVGLYREPVDINKASLACNWTEPNAQEVTFTQKIYKWQKPHLIPYGNGSDWKRKLKLSQTGLLDLVENALVNTSTITSNSTTIDLSKNNWFQDLPV